MRNPSKNTIKRVMRKAAYDKSIGMRFDVGDDYNSHNGRYHLYNSVGAHIYNVSKGQICNLGLIGIEKYLK